MNHMTVAAAVQWRSAELAAVVMPTAITSTTAALLTTSTVIAPQHTVIGIKITMAMWHLIQRLTLM
jgi:1-aminocyclopropane-1-carboxylate deaminase/D-cysteine desulfhydrase-like pyridoxal-dependent ACC family enzyme